MSKRIKADDLITPIGKQRVQLVSSVQETNPALVREKQKQRVEVVGEFFVESLEILLELSPEDFRWKAEEMQKELDRLVLKDVRRK